MRKGAFVKFRTSYYKDPLYGRVVHYDSEFHRITVVGEWGREGVHTKSNHLEVVTKAEVLKTLRPRSMNRVSFLAWLRAHGEKRDMRNIGFTEEQAWMSSSDGEQLLRWAIAADWVSARDILRILRWYVVGYIGCITSKPHRQVAIDALRANQQSRDIFDEAGPFVGLYGTQLLHLATFDPALCAKDSFALQAVYLVLWGYHKVPVKEGQLLSVCSLIEKEAPVQEAREHPAKLMKSLWEVREEDYPFLWYVD